MERIRRVGRVSLAFLRLEAVEDLSYPLSTFMGQFGKLVPVFVYFFVARLFELGGRGVTPRTGHYFTFMIIGFSVAALMQGALAGFGTRLQQIQDRGSFETLLIEPLPWKYVPLAVNMWKIVLGVIVASLMLTTGALLGARYNLGGVALFLIVCMLGVLAATAIGILACSLMVVAKRSAPVLSLYGMIASLFAGTIFPIELFPNWLRWISYLVPHTYVMDLARQALMAEPPSGVFVFWEGILGLLAFCVLASTVGLWLLGRAFEYSRRMGLLSGY